MAERVLERIRAEGPLSSRDFERERGSTTDWFGMPTNTVRALLEAYTWPTRGTGGPPGVPPLGLPPQCLAALCILHLYA
ncbi:MAG: hypothetical protein ACRDNY_03355 [Gaiellaceae bacterium]